MTHSKERFAKDRGLKGSDVFPDDEVTSRAAEAAAEGVVEFSETAAVTSGADIADKSYDAGQDLDGSAHGHSTDRFANYDTLA